MRKSEIIFFFNGLSNFIIVFSVLDKFMIFPAFDMLNANFLKVNFLKVPLDFIAYKHYHSKSEKNDYLKKKEME